MCAGSAPGSVEAMDLHTFETALVGLAAFCFILYRQLRAQPVDSARGARRPPSRTSW